MADSLRIFYVRHYSYIKLENGTTQPWLHFSSSVSSSRIHLHIQMEYWKECENNEDKSDIKNLVWGHKVPCVTKIVTEHSKCNYICIVLCFFPLLHNIQTGTGAQPASYPMGSGGCFSRNKAVGSSSWPLMTRLGMLEPYIHPPYVFVP
jgi:hypothetical protein